jgi:hypothetical protein
MASTRPSGVRRMILAGLGLALTAGFTIHFLQKPGVYYAESQVRFLAPLSKANPNSLVVSLGGVTSLAGTVGRLVEPHPPAGQVVSPLVTLTDEGVRNGWSVSLPNDGGQFTDKFDQQQLQVQVVGSSSEEVRRRIASLTAMINADLVRLQDQKDIPQVDRIITSPSPAHTDVVYLTGSRARTIVATFLLGFGLTVVADMLLGRRHRSRRRSDLMPNQRGPSAQPVSVVQ